MLSDRLLSATVLFHFFIVTYDLSHHVTQWGWSPTVSKFMLRKGFSMDLIYSLHHLDGLPNKAPSGNELHALCQRVIDEALATIHNTPMPEGMSTITVKVLTNTVPWEVLVAVARYIKTELRAEENYKNLVTSYASCTNSGHGICVTIDLS